MDKTFKAVTAMEIMLAALTVALWMESATLSAWGVLTLIMATATAYFYISSARGRVR